LIPQNWLKLRKSLWVKKIYPVEGVNQIDFYISPSDYWGITIEEAENEE